MQSQKPTISITLPSTAGIGTDRIFIGQPVDQNLYNAYLNPPGPGDVVNANIIFYESGWTPPDTGFKYIAQFDGGGLAIGDQGPGGPYELIFLFGSSISMSDCEYDPGYNISTETWNAVSKVNGWGNAAGNAILSYRRVPSPSHTVQITGRCTGGTATSGILIGTLPVGYRPLNSVQFPVTNNANATGVLGELNTSGQIHIFGTLTGADISINTLVPLNL